MNTNRNTILIVLLALMTMMVPKAEAQTQMTGMTPKIKAQMARQVGIELDKSAIMSKEMCDEAHRMANVALREALAERPACIDESFLELGDESITYGNAALALGNSNDAIAKAFHKQGKALFVRGETAYLADNFIAAKSLYTQAAFKFLRANEHWTVAETFFMSAMVAYEGAKFNYIDGQQLDPLFADGPLPAGM